MATFARETPSRAGRGGSAEEAAALRRRTQAALYRIASALVRLLAPLLPHTADEAWRALEGEDAECVHMFTFADVDCMRNIPFDERWKQVITSRDQWMREIEKFRQNEGVDNPLDLGVEVAEPLDGFVSADMADLCGVSRFRFGVGVGVRVVDLRDQPRCERSWKRDGTVPQRSNGGMLSDRDADAMGV